MPFRFLRSYANNLFTTEVNIYFLTICCEDGKSQTAQVYSSYKLNFESEVIDAYLKNHLKIVNFMTV